MTVLTATEVARSFSAVLDQVEHGDTVVITRGGRQVAVLEPRVTATGRALKDVLRRHSPDDGWLDDIAETRRLAEERDVAWPDA